MDAGLVKCNCHHRKTPVCMDAITDCIGTWELHGSTFLLACARLAAMRLMSSLILAMVILVFNWNNFFNAVFHKSSEVKAVDSLDLLSFQRMVRLIWRGQDQESEQSNNCACLKSLGHGRMRKSCWIVWLCSGGLQIVLSYDLMAEIVTCLRNILADLILCTKLNSTLLFGM